MDTENVKDKLDPRDKNDLTLAVDVADSLLKKSYLSVLDKSTIKDFKITVDNKALSEKLIDNVRFLDITQIVLNKNENVRDKLVTVFNGIGSIGASLLFMLRGISELNPLDKKPVFKTQLLIGTKVPVYKDEDKTRNQAELAQELLRSSLSGNFPGTCINDLGDSLLKKDILDDALQSEYSVVSITDVPGIRSEEENKERQFTQGIEKLVDTLYGKEFTLLVIADPINLQDFAKSRRALEELYSSLVPFSESQYTVGENESLALNKSLTKGTTDTITNSITDTVTHTVGKSRTVTNGISSTTTVGVSSTTTVGVSVTPFGVGANASESVGVNVSESIGVSHSVANGTNESDSKAHGITAGNSHGISESETNGETEQKGENRSIQIKFENHTVKQLLERIDETLKRFNTCSDLGMWNCAAYCLAKNEAIAQMAASTYQSLIRGKNSSLEQGCITLWGKEKSKKIINYLKVMEHPFFETNITPCTIVSSSELAIQMGLPNHSIPNVPVVECAEFGRNVSEYQEIFSTEKDKTPKTPITLGKIFHMHHPESLPVCLNQNNLTSHTFITGSTGVGKSNTVYRILEQLPALGKTFLVIEPAKGEYKNIFGNSELKVSVYGTNPEVSRLLKINPFSFPDGIHILEHLDRLVEIFNVCWPMYAAMPAVLKEAIEKAYEDAGWNLITNTNEFGEKLYPSFEDITNNVKSIIDESDYDTENKGAYKGSLITRLRSLTNGINGLIFTKEEISEQKLFDENVIVDLSRVGTAETKALIMGLLVLKLQEYRMSKPNMNSDLKHITVIEEAHNLLKKTSSDKGQDSGNIAGKSVEMLTNSIAEMRTYGEGFIIADQAPGLLDLAVIRNTNTKIIMRLPDQEDRELVGKAANLNDTQIQELARLPKGVAAVYQNDWIESVLCLVDKAKTPEKNFIYTKPLEKNLSYSLNERIRIATLLSRGEKLPNDSFLYDLKKKLKMTGLSDTMMVHALRCFMNPPKEPRMTKLAPIMAQLFPLAYQAAIEKIDSSPIEKEWTEGILHALEEEINNIQIDETVRRDICQCLVTNYVYNEQGNETKLEQWKNKGGLV